MQRDAPLRSRTRLPANVGVGATLLLVLSLALAACEYPGIPHPQASRAESPSSPALAATPTPTPQVQNPEPSEPEPLPDTVQIGLKDFKLDPDQVAAAAGTITFVLHNQGRYTHDFRVEGQGIDKKAPKVGRGRTFEWEITLEPGTYRISCPISNHAARGMTGTLEVVQ